MCYSLSWPPFQLHKIITRGDFNAILDHTMNTSNPLRVAHPDLTIWADTLGLQEIWRWKDRTYSYVSATHKSGSRIDLLFGTASTLSHVGAVSYLLAGLSDHSKLELCMTLGTAGELGCLRLVSHWIDNPQVQELVSPKLSEYWTLNEGSTSLDMV